MATIEVSCKATPPCLFDALDVLPNSLDARAACPCRITVNDHVLLMDERDGNGVGDDSSACIASTCGVQDVSQARGQAGSRRMRCKRRCFSTWPRSIRRICRIMCRSKLAGAQQGDGRCSFVSDGDDHGHGGSRHGGF